MKPLKKLTYKLAITLSMLLGLAGSMYAQEKIHPQINKIYLTSYVDNQTCSTKPKNTTLENKVNLNLVAETQKDGKTFYFSKSKNLCLNGEKVDTSKILSWTPDDLSIKWFKVESERDSYNNGGRDYFRWDTPTYKETLIDTNKWIIEADAHPTEKFKDINNGLGTMRYKVQIIHNGKKLSTPGKESTNTQGIKKDVHRVSFRKDDSFIGWLTSFFNLPYIYGSEGKNLANHQAENYVGADCADLLVAAYRKTGKNNPYTYAVGLRDFTNVILKQENLRTNGENYYDRQKLLKFGEDIKKGDLILFGRYHVGSIVEDRSDPNGKYGGQADGIFNKYDLMIHTLFDVPKKEGFTDQGPFSILRWKN